MVGRGKEYKTRNHNNTKGRLSAEVTMPGILPLHIDGIFRLGKPIIMVPREASTKLDSFIMPFLRLLLTPRTTFIFSGS